MRQQPSAYPLAYLITFRTYGTWLHGDERGSVDRYRNAYNTPRIPETPHWRSYKQSLLRSPPVTLDASRRWAVEMAIRDLCDEREWPLSAINVRTNHVHAVVTAWLHPADAIAALKASATRRMRETGCWSSDRSPWAHGGSKRYLWTAESVARAIDYVVNGQGDDLPTEPGA